MNPTQDVLEKRLAAMEGGMAALALSSGQAAETLAILTLASAGDEIVSTTSLYGGTYNLFPLHAAEAGRHRPFRRRRGRSRVARAINEKTKAVYTETVGNPKLDIVDIEKLAGVAHENGLPLIIDNTTPSPALCRPIETRRRHRRSIADEIHRRHGLDRRRDHRRRKIRLEGFGPFPGFHHARSFVPRNRLFGRVWPAGVHPQSRVQALRDIGACYHAVQFILFCKAPRRCTCAWSAIPRTRSKWRNSCRPIRRSSGQLPGLESSRISGA